MNRTKELMRFFVGEIIGRRITPADWRGRHMKSAKTLLKDYDFDDICGALYSLKAREYTHFGYDNESELPNRLEGMEVLWYWGEPPLIERWLTTPSRPDVYSHDYDVWVQMHGRRAISRGEWDGIYLRQDPSSVKDWLLPIIGMTKYEESYHRWQTRLRT